MLRVTQPGSQEVPATHQLAIDEAMLLEADESVSSEPNKPADWPGRERIRVWTFDRPVVVLGRASKVADEVNRDFCDRMHIPIERRCSGGASVVGGRGCLMYSVVISHIDKPELKQIDAAHRYVMQRVLHAVQQQVPDARQQGICDLTWKNRKFSGNSLRISRHHLLYHGTILHDFDLQLLAECLRFAPRQPDYRAGRDHRDFVTNVPIGPASFMKDLCSAFGLDVNNAQTSIAQAAYDPRAKVLAADRYDHDRWRFRH